MAEFNPTKADAVWQLTFEGAWPTAVAFLGSHRKLAAGNRAGQLFVWDLPEMAESKDEKSPPSVPPTRQLAGHTNGVTRLCATADGRTLISASLDHTVRLWPTDAAASGTAEVVLDGDAREAEAKRTRKDDALNRPGVTVEVQDTSHALPGHSDWVNGLYLCRDQQRLITGDDKGHVIVWDLPQRQPLSQWDGYPGNWVTSAALTPDGQTAFVAEYCGRRGDFDRPPAQARFWNVADGTETLDVLKVQFPNVKQRDNSYGYSRTWGEFVKSGLVAADISPDGKLLAVAQGGETDTGKIHLIEVATGKLVRTVSGHQYGATDVVFSSNGEHVVSTGRDTMLRVCQVEDGKEVLALGKSRGGQFKDWLSALAISPDQQWLAAADIAGIIHVWRLTA